MIVYNQELGIFILSSRENFCVLRLAVAMICAASIGDYIQNAKDFFQARWRLVDRFHQHLATELVKHCLRDDGLLKALFRSDLSGFHLLDEIEKCASRLIVSVLVSFLQGVHHRAECL